MANLVFNKLIDLILEALLNSFILVNEKEMQFQVTSYW